MGGEADLNANRQVSLATANGSRDGETDWKTFLYPGRSSSRNAELRVLRRALKRRGPQRLGNVSGSCDETADTQARQKGMALSCFGGRRSSGSGSDSGQRAMCEKGSRKFPNREDSPTGRTQKGRVRTRKAMIEFDEAWMEGGRNEGKNGCGMVPIGRHTDRS